MIPVKYLVLGAALLVEATIGAQAQQYQPYPYYHGYPPSWSYDPYTSGMTSCPQWFPGQTTPCRDEMPPTYGQPDYRPR